MYKNNKYNIAVRDLREKKYYLIQMMKYSILYFFLVTHLIASPKAKQLVNNEACLKLLETIKKDSIVLGHGEIEVHIFIDPLCPMSQRYLKRIYKENNNLFAQYTLYIYLHEIKSKKSKKHILNILSAESNERMLRAIMLEKEKFTLKDIRNRKVEDSFERVAKVATKIGVYKRPYIMIEGKAK